MSSKGNYTLVEDLFENKYKPLLPVNLYILREENTDNTQSEYYEKKEFVKSDAYQTNNYLAGYFYKTI